MTVTATSSRIALGQSTDLTCSITRSVPSNYTIEWTLTNTDDVTTTLSDTEETLVITDIAEDEFGVYICTVTNSANLSGSANITIEQGGKKHCMQSLLRSCADLCTCVMQLLQNRFCVILYAQFSSYSHYIFW